MVRTVFAAFGLALMASTAQAQTADLTKPADGHVYFHRPGADMAAHDSAVRFCFDQAAMTQQPDITPSTPGRYDPQYGLIGALVETLVESAIDGVGARRGFASNLENCMVATGWQVVRLPEAEGKRIAALPRAGKYEALSALIGQPMPSGTVVRRFDNDIQNHKTRWLQTTGDMDRYSLSILAYDRDPWERAHNTAVSKAADAVKEARKSKVPPPFPQPGGTAPVPQDQWGKLPTDRSYILIRTLRTEGWPTGRLLFQRLGPDPTRPAWQQDGKIDLFFAEFPVNKKVKKGELVEASFVLELPPGRWTYMGVYGLPSVGMRMPIITSFCLGAPVCDLGEGEVLYAGAFGIGILEGQIAPDTNLDGIRHLTDAAPGLRDRLKPAPWMNGGRFSCDGTYIYALETPGRPFLPGYRFGSEAWRTPPEPSITAPDTPSPGPPAPIPTP